MENFSGTRKTVLQFINAEGVGDDEVLFICDTQGELVVEADVQLLKAKCPMTLSAEVYTFNKHKGGRHYVEIDVARVRGF